MSASVRFLDCEMPFISRKGLSLEEYRKKKKLIEEDVDSRKRVVVNIELEANPRFDFRINGMAIPMKAIQNLHDLDMKRFDIQLEALSAMRDSGKQMEVLQLVQNIMR
ncbi:MAG: hypothetical protein ABII22_04500 [Candidatus Micrarchaeota archaeon]